MHTEAHAFVGSAVNMYGPFDRVIEFGSLNINGSVRGLMAEADYVGLDEVEGPDVDVVGDCRHYEPERKVDAVVCCEVLEHTVAPHSYVKAAAGMLKRGGHIIITAATEGREPHSAVDGGPLRKDEHYDNVDPDKLEGWLKAGGFTVVDVQVHPDRGDVYAVGRKK